MTTQTIGGYQGETYNELLAQLSYVNQALSSDLQAWERKEYEIVKSDIDFKISEILN